jgi:hypothetical protein
MRARCTVRGGAITTDGSPFLGREPEVLVGARGGHAPARRPVEEAGLDEERLVHVLDGVPFLVDGGGQAVDADRAAAELVDDRPQQLAIDLVEAVLVHLEQLQRRARHITRDAAVGPHLRVVADPSQQPVGDARRAARPARDLGGGLGSMVTSRMRADRRTISTMSRSA